MVSSMNVFSCDVCGLIYLDRNLAEACEVFCNENHACNPELKRQSIGIKYA